MLWILGGSWLVRARTQGMLTLLARLLAAAPLAGWAE